MATAAATRRHAKLRRQLSDYAETMGVSIATLKFWIRRGKDRAYPVPFDEPEKFADWWSACMDRPVPSRLRVAGGSTNAFPSAPLTAKRDLSDIKGLDIADNVKSLRRTLAINQRLLDEAAESNDERLYNLRKRMHGECFNRLRLAEVSLTELQKMRGQLIDRDQVITDHFKVVAILKQMREHMTRDVMIELEKACPKRFKRIFSQLSQLLEPAIEKVRLAEEQIFARGLSGWGSAGARES